MPVGRWGEEENRIRERYIRLQFIKFNRSRWLVGSLVFFILFMVKIKLNASRSRIRFILYNSSVE